MLINCPRCGFSQPTDQYCAHCGVDMLAFKPKSDPFYIQIIKSSKTHIFLIIVLAIYIGRQIISTDEPQRWVQKVSRSQLAVKATQPNAHKASSNPVQTDNPDSIASHATNSTSDLKNIENKEINVASATEQPVNINTSNGSTTAADGQKNSFQHEANQTIFKINYAEVPAELISKWISESSSQGQFQNLTDYSVGVISDFKKKTDSAINSLKLFEQKLSTNQSETQYSGIMSDDSTSLIGLATTIELKSIDNSISHGSITIVRGHRQGREQFPAEFDLQKGSVMFILGVLKRQSLQAERALLNMPPFQIFKSPDFMAQKTEFVILVESEYK